MRKMSAVPLGLFSHSIRIDMTEIKKPKNYIDSEKRKSKTFNQPKPKSYGKLGKQGRIYQNDLLSSDYTAVGMQKRKLK
jgi:hypothetical protein